MTYSYSCEIIWINLKVRRKYLQIYNNAQFLTETQSPNFKIQPNTIIQGDCLNVMKYLPDNSIDMILTDPPFGTTQCKWDSIIPLEPMWEQLKRIIKPNGAILLMAQTPFDKVLGASNLDMLKYEWVYEKTAATGHLNAKKAPMKAHENILVFYKKQPTYNPQKKNNRTQTNKQLYKKTQR